MTAWPGTDARRATYQRGRWAEQAAVDYLQRQGLTLQDRNYHSPFGEIDIIMREHASLVFIEVRYRANETFCPAVETISRTKQQRIRTTAEHYLQQQRQAHKYDCRFDVITLSGPQQSPAYNWMRNAF
ncbi:putative endonuclease [Methylohalomonas lacus]|uniref:UPF0102 protein J2T55_000233 n=1 Tax=Methylohalomonas lacus TaxID=398773 RepID=A0AAE3HH83_9GAMM|nr:YraN family protein [Methylohalomonas lacus]MCS3902241.1 putative endonuclease [Methylohalomonas lacus]